MKKLILSLVVSTLMACSFPIRANAELSSADKEFLLQQCQIFKDDVDFIPKLPEKTQAELCAWITARDCNKFAPFKNTRNYYKYLLTMVPSDAMSFPRPPLGWDEAYLTKEELKQYGDIVKSHPPCSDIWPERANAELSLAQKEFLMQQCQISQADIDIIPKLIQKAQDNIARWIAAGDFKKLVPLKNTRDYYRKLLEQPGKLPMPPATWDVDYVTEEEFLNYSNILNNTPP